MKKIDEKYVLFVFLVDRRLQSWHLFLLGDYRSVALLIIVGLARSIAVNGCLLEKIK